MSRVDCRILRKRAAGDFVLTECLYWPELRMAPHSDGVHHLSFMLGGSLTEVCDRQRNECAACSLVVKPAGAVHTTCIGRTGAHLLRIERPTVGSGLGDWGDGDDRYVWRHEGFYSGLAFRIYREFLLNDASSLLAVEGMCMELLGHLWRHGADSNVTRRPPQWLDPCVELIRSRLSTPIRTSELAIDLGLHPVYLARAFRHRFRCSLGEYVRRLRIENAARELASTSEPLCQVALSAGFSDQAHFTRAFKSYTGFTPGQFRSVHACRTQYSPITQ